MAKNKTNQARGKSKYAMKVERRKRLSRELGLPDTPFPVLWKMGVSR